MILSVVIDGLRGCCCISWDAVDIGSAESNPAPFKTAHPSYVDCEVKSDDVR